MEKRFSLFWGTGSFGSQTLQAKDAQIQCGQGPSRRPLFLVLLVGKCAFWRVVGPLSATRLDMHWTASSSWLRRTWGSACWMKSWTRMISIASTDEALASYEDVKDRVASMFLVILTMQDRMSNWVPERLAVRINVRIYVSYKYIYIYIYIRIFKFTYIYIHIHIHMQM